MSITTSIIHRGINVFVCSQRLCLDKLGCRTGHERLLHDLIIRGKCLCPYITVELRLVSGGNLVIQNILGINQISLVAIGNVP